MLDPDRGRVTATGQSRRGRVVLEHAFEHGVWPTRHGEFAREDHDRRSGGVHADRTGARFADPEWLAFGVAINSGRAGRQSEPDCGASTTAGAIECTGNFTRDRAGSVTIIIESTGVAEQVVCSLVRSFVEIDAAIAAIIAAAILRASLHAEVAELADAHV